MKLPARTFAQKTAINPAILQPMLESASNAAAKGQAQYLTPIPWSAALSKALPNYRPCIVDLTCGHGTLLAGAAAPSTDHLLGCDIDSELGDPRMDCAASIYSKRVTADITLFYSILRQVGWRFDVGVFNPAWDLHQYRDRVAQLEDSGCSAVRIAFAAHDGRTAAGTIDSTALLMMIALDRMTTYGEAVLIANQASLDRLILKPGAHHHALRDHVWAHVIIPGNICDPNRERSLTANGPSGTDFNTGVLYFARDHGEGFDDENTLLIAPDATTAQVAAAVGRPEFRNQRNGARLRPGCAHAETVHLWMAAREEWALRTATLEASNPNRWNLWLDVDNCIRTNLSVFDEASGRVNKQEADRLFKLNGKRPIHLVMARESRRELERAIHDSPWRVAPAVSEAVQQAIVDYNRERAPLYALNKIQRLGYVEEQDTILCQQDLGPFLAGNRYRLRTETVRVKRTGTKMNVEGGLDDVEYEGSELAIFIESAAGEQLFMEERMRDASVKLSIQDEDAPSPIKFNLLQLVDHFEIPNVPDVATVNPEGYQRNLDMLHEIERLVA